MPRRLTAAVAALCFAMLFSVVMGVAAKPNPVTYSATVIEVTDGDTVRVWVDDWATTPFADIKVRIAGIDSPETHMPPGKCEAEVKLGIAAADYARTLIKKGDKVGVVYLHPDKYAGRIDAHLIMPDGRSFGDVMLASGHAVAYDGGRKSSFCQRKTTFEQLPQIVVEPPK